MGDRVINAVAELLNAHFSHCGLVGRLGGDEFSVFAENIARKEMLEATETLCRRISGLTVEGRHDISCSVGITSCKGKTTFLDAYKAADKALYKAKRQGKKRCIMED